MKDLNSIVKRYINEEENDEKWVMDDLVTATKIKRILSYSLNLGLNKSTENWIDVTKISNPASDRYKIYYHTSKSRKEANADINKMYNLLETYRDKEWRWSGDRSNIEIIIHPVFEK